MASILGHVIVKITRSPPREPNGTFSEGCTKSQRFCFPGEEHCQITILTDEINNTSRHQIEAYRFQGGTRWRSWLKKVGRSRVRFPMVSLEFFIDIILPTTLWPGVDSASNRKDCEEYFLGGKGDRCVGLTTFRSRAACLEIWMSQPPGTLWVCPGL